MVSKQKRETLFAELNEQDQVFLLAQGTEILGQKGNYLFLEGDETDHIYLIKSGKVRLSKTNAEGKMLFFQLKQADDFIGELSLYNNFKATCNADVIKDVVLIRYERAVLEEICRQNSTIAIAFMKWFTKNNNYLLAQFRDLIFCGKKGALFSILIRLSNAHGQNIESGIFINKKLTNQELANYIGATRESINRILKNLIKHKIISIHAKFITIHNVKFLQQHLRCGNCPFEECTI